VSEAQAQAQITLHVTDADTAQAVGSGDLPVLGTPRLIALAEQATVAAAKGLLAAGQTTVGTRIRFDHLYPTAVG
jgi:predicted thioesterase